MHVRASALPAICLELVGASTKFESAIHSFGIQFMGLISNTALINKHMAPPCPSAMESLRDCESWI